VAAVVNERFIPVRLEGRGHKDLAQQMDVRRVPTTIIFSPDGREKHRFVGFLPPEDYLKRLRPGSPENQVMPAGFARPRIYL